VLAVQVVVLEDAGPVAALRRSYVLVRGRRGQVFSTLLGATFQVGFASYLFDVPFQLAAVALTRNAAHPPLIAVAISIAGKLLAGALSLPLLAGMLVLLYVDLRIRKEGIVGALKGALQSEVLTASEFTSIWRPADSSASLPLENSSSLNLYLSRL
jgi:hypothetical protein